ncbi:MAG: NADPH-dependent FMN reductase [Dehalococcoidia bacterium]
MAFRVLGVNGSLRAGSTADRALRFALAALTAEGAICEAFEIASLPLFDGREEDQYPAAVAAWRAACSAADGLIIATPSFHGSLPGGLKNALDFLDEPHVGGKPVAMIGIAAGDAEPGAAETVKVLRHIRAVTAIPDVVVSRSGQHWGPGDRPANAGVAIAIGKVAADLVALCKLRESGDLPQP